MARPLPVYEGDSGFVFVSYAHGDGSLATDEIRRIQDLGIRVWYDNGIQVGKEWSDELAERIERCACFLFLITPNSIASENCRRELNFALSEGRPVLSIQLAPTQLPRGLRLNLDNRQALLKHELPEAEYRDRLRRALTELLSPEEPLAAPSGSARRWLRGSSALALAGLAVALSFFGYRWWQQTSNVRWLAEEAIPAIDAHLELGHWDEAYTLTREADGRLPGNPLVKELWLRLSWETTIPSEPSGATVYRRAYDADDAPWEMLGQTPLERIRFPYGLSRLRFELEGHMPLERTLGGGHVNWKTLDDENSDQRHLIGISRFRLETPDTLPAGTVRVPGGNLTGDPSLVFQEFYIGRHEVSNAEYLEFVEAGGYERPEFWEPVVLEANRLADFVDRTGRPGPSTWEAGLYPNGQAQHPVAGLSWFEASAYARFRGASLPSVYHWLRATAPAELQWVVPRSNFASSGTLPVGATGAMSYAGNFDMAGNVREWTSTAIGDERIILGGGWNDPYYVIRQWDTSASPYDRSPSNGLRLAIVEDPPEGAPLRKALAPVERREMDDPSYEPVAEDVFAAYGRSFDYDRRPLRDATTETAEARLWRRERIEYDAAYGDGRSVLYLYLPAGADEGKPLQTVVYWPGWDTFFLNDVDGYLVKQLDFIVKSGRAVAFPLYYGTFAGGSRGEFNKASYRDNTTRTVKDLRRAIDYLETREDLDASRLGFFGYSWGGATGPVALAQEPRLRTAIIYIGMLPPLWQTPEVDPLHALPRVKVPTLLLSGEFDIMVPLENARRYYELLAIPEPDKRHVIAAGAHFVPRDVLIRETLDWLDHHLGPTR